MSDELDEKSIILKISNEFENLIKEINDNKNTPSLLAEFQTDLGKKENEIKKAKRELIELEGIAPFEVDGLSGATKTAISTLIDHFKGEA